MKEIIETKNAPAAIGPYSQAIKTGDIIITAGQIALSPTTGDFVADDIAGQTDRSLRTCVQSLKQPELT